MIARGLDGLLSVDVGELYLTGTEALAALPVLQRRRDAAAGLDTAGFVSGYRGSPLGGLDQTLWRSAELLERHRIRFQPAINEEMAATAIIGTQQLALFPGQRHQGVFALWYGKGPGLDRAGDALKHANSYGSAAHGGVLVVVGDDHGAVSSSLAHQSEQLMASWSMPVLAPAGLQDFLGLGLLGWGLSRYSGCYAGFITVSETAESSGRLRVDPASPAIVLPQDFELPPGGLHLRFPDRQLDQEERLQRWRLPAAQAFARANRLDRVVVAAPRRRLGIVGSGKAWLDLMEALAQLGLDDDALARLGISLYKVGLAWPLEPEGARAFARGHQTLLVIEEKRAFVESQLKELLYHLPAAERPAVLGKSDAAGRPLLPATGEIGPEQVAAALAGLIPEIEQQSRWRAYAERIAARRRAAQAAAASPPRPPYFCAGCPHNRSTNVPESATALAGTGCHMMAMGMNRHTLSILHMGAEGANWVGLAPFLEAGHVFANCGDGTFVHSGSLALRQAVAAGMHMTYKLLFNDAVAMTGGQPPEGAWTAERMAWAVHGEGVRTIAVVSDDPARLSLASMPPGTGLHGRDALDQVQAELARAPGVSVLLFDQMCATERRRRRKRGEMPAAPRRLFINDRVCENCGDCSERSNCVAVVPVETPFGRKRAIDQSNCNQDYSCLDGYCPSFVSVEGQQKPRRGGAEPPFLPPPPVVPALDRPWNILIAGIGGTGVVTIGQVIGIAADIEGRAASVLDFNGLAQKGGGVISHLRLADRPERLHAPRIPLAAADVMLACDLVVANTPDAVLRLERGRTRTLANTDVAATAAAVLARDGGVDATALRRRLAEAVGSEQLDEMPAVALAEALFGDAIFANMLMLGFAFQRGLIPVGLAAVEAAIAANGVAVADNRRAFAWGRLGAVDPATLRRAAGLDGAAAVEESTEDLIARRAADLADYHDQAYAERYRRLLAEIAAADRRLPERGGALTRVAARAYHRALAVKDEYEVARLLTLPAFWQDLSERFEPGATIRFHLAPPILGGVDPASGRAPKRAFGVWLLPPLRLLARLRRLRGTPFDIFGWTAERRDERRLILDYEVAVREILTTLSEASYDSALAVAALPEEVRGYGPIKRKAMDKFQRRRAQLLDGHRRTRASRDLAAE